MTDIMEEISMLMDGECSIEKQKEILNKIKKDKELQKIWHRFHIMRDVLKKRTDVLSSDIKLKKIKETTNI